MDEVEDLQPNVKPIFVNHTQLIRYKCQMVRCICSDLTKNISDFFFAQHFLFFYISILFNKWILLLTIFAAVRDQVRVMIWVQTWFHRGLLGLGPFGSSWYSFISLIWTIRPLSPVWLNGFATQVLSRGTSNGLESLVIASVLCGSEYPAVMISGPHTQYQLQQF